MDADPRKLDLACGRRCCPGYTGVDVSSDTDATVIHDLRVRPWPWADGFVECVRCQHFFEHLTGPERIGFMEELHRILVPGGTATIITPYWASWRAIADPTHVFPPVCEQSYCYYSREWRQLNKLTHYPIRCNFTFEYKPVYNPEVGFPDDEARQLGAKHYNNVIDDLEVMLTKEP